tara:strand:- start:15381 stop:15959 length:579 start_codon:yes stop_codon:yes gene_type:complete
MTFKKSSAKFMALIIALFTFSSATQAGALIEPYLGYGIGSGDRNNTDYDYNTPQFGARLGYQMLGLMGGIDYSLAPEFDLEAETAGSTSKIDTDKNQLGLFVGYEFPILLRAWATYYLSSKLETTSATATTEYSGGGYALGVGFTGLPFVSLNLEYRMFSYDEVETGSFKGDLDPELELNEIFLSVSLPLNI